MGTYQIASREENKDACGEEAEISIDELSLYSSWLALDPNLVLTPHNAALGNYTLTVKATSTSESHSWNKIVDEYTLQVEILNCSIDYDTLPKKIDVNLALYEQPLTAYAPELVEGSGCGTDPATRVSGNGPAWVSIEEDTAGEYLRLQPIPNVAGAHTFWVFIGGNDDEGTYTELVTYKQHL